MLPDCIEGVGCRRNGYVRVRRGGPMVSLHRWVWEQEHGPIPSGMEVCHRCDNPPCCNIEHLFLGTHSDNMQDAAAKGRLSGPSRRGEGHARNQHTGLKEADVRAIRAETGTHAEIAERFGVSRSTVKDIRQRKTWRHVR